MQKLLLLSLPFVASASQAARLPDCWGYSSPASRGSYKIIIPKSTGEYFVTSLFNYLHASPRLNVEEASPVDARGWTFSAKPNRLAGDLPYPHDIQHARYNEESLRSSIEAMLKKIAHEVIIECDP